MIKSLKKIIRPALVAVGMRDPQPKATIEKPFVSTRTAPTPEEQRHIDALRADVRALPPLAEDGRASEAEKKWIDRQRKLRTNILTKDPRDFFSWEEIKYSMLGEYVPHELAFLKSSPSWPLWRDALAEREFCEQDATWDNPGEGRATMIGNAFKLSQLIVNQNVDLTKIDTILEFGGGYGSIARLCHRLGFKGTYIIFDLPEFSILQKYFLSASGLKATIQYKPTKERKGTVVLLSKISDLQEQVRNIKPDIFIATWSLSESPLPLRKSIVELIKGVTYYLIAYQEKFPMFNGVDNVAYFKQFQKDQAGREWKTYPFKLHPRDFFLIGKKID